MLHDCKNKLSFSDEMANVTQALTISDDVSPVTLNDHWSRLARLILLASMSTVGCVGNVFMMSAVMIEDYLRKRGKNKQIRFYFRYLLPNYVSI